MAHDAARAELRRAITPELYRQIRRLWISHSIAEDKRDIAGLLDTLTEDCVYEVVQTGDRWEGHAGATAFYEGMFEALPDVSFDLVNIVIGPQGVFEEALVHATHARDWLAFPASGKRVTLRTAILFPWDHAQMKFRGERIFLASDAPLRG